MGAYITNISLMVCITISLKQISVLTYKEIRTIMIPLLIELLHLKKRIKLYNEKASFSSLFIVAFCLAGHRSDSMYWVSKRTRSKNVLVEH